MGSFSLKFVTVYMGPGARPIGFKVWLGGMWESELRYNIIHTNFNSALAIKKKEKEEDNNVCLST